MRRPVPTVFVEDAGDWRLSPYLSLTDADLRRGVEGEPAADAPHGVFVGEGAIVLRRLLDWRVPLLSIALAEPRVDAMADVIAAAPCPVYVAPQAVLDRVAGYRVHRGVLCLGARPAPRGASDLAAATRRIAVLDGIADQENVGSIFRSAAVLGFEGALVAPDACDPLSRRCVRVSMGHTVSLPFARATPWPDALADLRAAGWRVVALTPAPGAEAIDRFAAALGADDRVAVVLGSEGPGVSAGALDAADVLVRIPMAVGADSLNVGAAAAIAFHRLTVSLG